MVQYCHASHEVYHEGVAQRAHNSLTCAFRRCQASERKFLPLFRHRFAENGGRFAGPTTAADLGRATSNTQVTCARRQRLVAPQRAARRPMPLAPLPQIPHRAALGAHGGAAGAGRGRRARARARARERRERWRRWRPSTSSSGMRSPVSSGTMKRPTAPSCGTATAKLPPAGGAPVSPADG